MGDFYFIVLLVMLAGAIISEVTSLIFIERIVYTYDQDAEYILKDRLLQILSVFSLIYIISLVMMFFSGVERFVLYSFIIGGASLFEFFLRGSSSGRITRITIGSSLSLLLLLDAFRHIIFGIFL